MAAHTYYWAIHAPIGDPIAKAVLQFYQSSNGGPAKLESVVPLMQVNCDLSISYAENGSPTLKVSAVEGEGHAYFAVTVSDSSRDKYPPADVSIEGIVCSTWVKTDPHDTDYYRHASPQCRVKTDDQGHQASDADNPNNPGRCN